MNLPNDVGAKETQEFLKYLEKGAVSNECFLIEAARQIEKEEETLDSVYSKIQEMDTDYRRLDFSSKSAQEKTDLLKTRYEEISQEISTIESELPLLSSVPIQQEQLKGDILSSHQIFRFLELLSQRHAFLLDSYRKLQEKVEPDNEHEISGERTVATRQSGVDRNLLRISEGKSKQVELEWELNELEDSISALKNAENLFAKK